MALRVLTWNLKHGRAVPPAGRDLFDDFAAMLASWRWDIALLQEVPPWWPEQLGYEFALVLTSRNLGLAARRAVAVRWPEVIKSNGGGCNAILTRDHPIALRRTLRLALLPERRRLIAVKLVEDDLWVGNLHTSGRGRAEPDRGAAALRAWAADGAAVLGGDFNLRAPALDGYVHAGGFDVDHVFVRGLTAAAPEVLDARPLSDHAPVIATVTRAAPRSASPDR